MSAEYNITSSDKEDNLQDFNELFFKHERKLFVYSHLMLGNEKEAKEIVQEIFLKIWEHQSFMDKSLDIDSHIFEVAQHIIYARIKKNIRSSTYFQRLT